MSRNGTCLGCLLVLVFMVAGASACTGCGQSFEPECDPADGEVLICGVGDCEEEVPACVDGRLARSCDDVDLGEHGEETCGIGACEVTVPECRDGKPVTCTPGEPAHFREICGTGIDEDCNGMVDCSDPACFETRLLVDECRRAPRALENPAGGYVLIAQAKPRQDETTDLIHVSFDQHGDPIGEPVILYESHSMGGNAYSFAVEGLEESYLLFTAVGTRQNPPQRWLELLEVGFDGEVMRSVEIAPPGTDGLSARFLQVNALSPHGPYLLTCDYAGFRWVLVDAEGALLSPWQAEEDISALRLQVVTANGQAALIWHENLPWADYPDHVYNVWYRRLDHGQVVPLDETVLVHELVLSDMDASMTLEGELLVAIQEYDEDTDTAELLVKRFDQDDELVDEVSPLEARGRFDSVSMATSVDGYWLVFDYTDETEWAKRFFYLHIDRGSLAAGDMKPIGGVIGDNVSLLLGGRDLPRVLFSRPCVEERGLRRIYLRDMNVCPDGFEIDD